ncbi:uncharacterized protein Z518_09592 [Rhinocladiella mackenziei CBS 650.93]|uniref:Calpain catalytic domain-containing protein n=1 Tax=Rhinocladiella mackenziei CBS 650.93 TaxID=1442369 RepID=A0A0D2IZ07_9EURO|nr:uncharacterized protein Z518_09592 [Rhinocladiella mackenziei CBS 650.93]KIX01865.1 hypothetical protein Z518_09592 [Rhinocladiella mackenziei CBS 650.93]
MDTRQYNLEEQARSIEKTIPSKTSDHAALEATIKSAELYLQALRLADKPSDRKRLDTRCKALLAQAERLKTRQDSPSRSMSKKEQKEDLQAPVSSRKLSTRENIIILEGSKLNGFIFKPWTSPPSFDEFVLRDGGSSFTDSSPLPLSSTQLESFAGWKRPREALQSIRAQPNGQIVPSEAVMHLESEMDLVQDMTSDCSVVASLCAGTARMEHGHSRILHSVMHPFDPKSDRLSLSPNGKYILKLYFNGCWRRVEIDDYLPTSKNARVLHVIDRRHPGLLWPALVEKAYLKVRGGYDFPGSNSGTDLAVLTGWIPQQIFLHDEDVEPECLWEEIATHFRKGHVLITIGTGKLPRREQRHLGLAAEHDYAILDISSERDVKEMLVKNPWADGDVWRGATRRKPNRSDEERSDNPSESDGMMPGTFWMDFNSVFQYFENMYINWNPGLFTHRQDIHFSWQQDQMGLMSNILVDNPQFAVTPSGTGEIWLLLNRHFRTGDYTQATAGKNGYISIFLYARDGNKVISNEGATMRGPFVDSPNTLLRITSTAKTTYTAVLVSQDLPPGKLNFTLSAFSKGSVTVSEARLQYPQKQSLKSAWTRSTAGGNSDSANYLSNPQFQVSLNESTQKIALVLRVADQEDENQSTRTCSKIHVKVLVVFSDGSRITRLRPRDVLAHSGDYRQGNAVLETELARGNYTIICSTFDQNQYADFILDLYSSSENQVTFAPLPTDGSGRLTIKSTPALFSNGANRLLAPLTVMRMSRMTFVVRHDRAAVAQSSLFKMTLEQGQGPYKETMASSEVDNEEFSSVTSGLRIGDLDLQPSMCGPGTGGLWLVLERLPQGGQGSVASRDEVLGVEIFTDERAELGAWGLGEG